MAKQSKVKATSINLSKKTHDAIVKECEKERRSVSGMIEILALEALEARKKKQTT
jgi:hypothetical protein